MNNVPKDIIERAAQGDEQAFRELYQMTARRVYGTALRITGNQPDAEEVTQDVFMKIHHQLKTFKTGTSFMAWVYRITVNTAINAYHKRKRRTVREDDFEIVIGKTAGSSAVTALIEQEHHEKQVQKLLGMLNPDQRACLVLREIEGLDYKEIATALKININTVRTRLKRAREVLVKKTKGVISHEM